jgi:hypothetical protein
VQWRRRWRASGRCCCRPVTHTEATSTCVNPCNHGADRRAAEAAADEASWQPRARRRYPHESQSLERQSKTPAVMPATIGMVDVLLASMSRKGISYQRDASRRPPHMVHLATRDSTRTLSGFGSCRYQDLAQHACQKRLDTVPVRFGISFHEGPRGTKEQVKVIKMFAEEILII